MNSDEIDSVVDAVIKRLASEYYVDPDGVAGENPINCVKGAIFKRMKGEYHFISKDDWRAYFIKTLATVFLAGIVTLAAVFGVIYSGTTAALNREIGRLAEQAREKFKAFENKDFTVRSLKVESEFGKVLEITETGAILLLGSDGNPKVILKVENDGRGGHVEVISSNGASAWALTTAHGCVNNRR